MSLLPKLKMLKIEKFAKENKLKITKDECGDQIIKAKQGHDIKNGIAKTGAIKRFKRLKGHQALVVAVLRDTKL
jgi:hypothetical protein